MTYREIVYMCLDILKEVSDDAHFTEDHIIFLVDKFRAMILKQRYEDLKKEIPESNYQTICLSVEEYPSTANDSSCAMGNYMRSTEKIPNVLTIGHTSVSSFLDFFKGDIAYINNERFKYTGYNPYLKNQIYATTAPDKYLYMKSANPQVQYLRKVKMTGVFEDSAKASELACDGDGAEACDIMDKRYPLEEALVPTVIELVLKELGTSITAPKDTANDASDDLDKLAHYLARNLRDRRR